MKTYAFIFARGNSQGLPNKNILKMSGIPLIAHSILIANQIKEIDKIFVSTEDENIARIAREYKAEVIQRPIELASHIAAEWDCWRHAIDWVNKSYGDFDYFLSLPATAPLRSVEDVRNCLLKIREDIDIVITVSEAKRNPWFNIVNLTKDDLVEKILKNKDISRRQDCPKVFDITTVAYVSRPGFVLQSSQIWDGRVSAVEIPPERAIDIDTKLDFDIASFIMNNRS